MAALTAQIIEAEDGEQIVVFPPGFEIASEKVRLERDGDRVIVRPLQRRRRKPKA